MYYKCIGSVLTKLCIVFIVAVILKACWYIIIEYNSDCIIHIYMCLTNILLTDLTCYLQNLMCLCIGVDTICSVLTKYSIVLMYYWKYVDVLIFNLNGIMCCSLHKCLTIILLRDFMLFSHHVYVSVLTR